MLYFFLLPIETWPPGYKVFSMLNSTEFESSTPYKN